MKTVLTGTHHPEKPQPKRTRRSPKKRRSEKSEVATPEFGTNSLDKPSHGEPTRKTEKTEKTEKAKPTLDRSNEKAWGNTDQTAALKALRESGRHVPYTEYHRELRKARDRRNDQIRVAVREAEIVSFALGIVIGTIIGLGAWWCWHLFA